MIYAGRGLDQSLASEVATQLMAHDALAAHARDELGISVNFTARPVQAALASAVSFAIGAAMPLLVAFAAPQNISVPVIFGTTLIFLAGLGTMAGFAGGSNMARSAIRVTFWGALAMGITSAVGALVGKGF